MADSDSTVALTARRFRDGDDAPRPWQQEIFDADHSGKCPTYVLSTPPCQAACPAGEDIRGYLDIARGIDKPAPGATWQEHAFARLARANPFPAVMGRVCPAPCESRCNRHAVEESVAINAVEHYLGDYAIAHGLAFEKPRSASGRRVAVIGGGPAGLSCAYQLAMKGHRVTVFEQSAALGGMMRYGIPEFRTPRNVLDAEIDRILELGIETRLRCRVGTDVPIERIRADFDAVFLGLGAQSSRMPELPGAQAPNFVSAIAFLRAFNDGRLRHVSRRIVVIGGGDTSLDVATVSKRLGYLESADPHVRPEEAISGEKAHDVPALAVRQGCEVTLTSVFPKQEMQASPHELAEAMAEGVNLVERVMPVAVVLDEHGRACALRVAPCRARFAGPRLEITRIPGAEQDIPADLIVSAIGQSVDLAGFEAIGDIRTGIATGPNGDVGAAVGLFAGGDVVRPHLLATAIHQGAIAAESIDAHLRGVASVKRAKVDVCAFDLPQRMREAGLTLDDLHDPIRGTFEQSVVHNFDDRSDRAVIGHDKLFLGHFGFLARHEREVAVLSAASALGHFGERRKVLPEAAVVAESKRCMSCGLCFECDNCVVYCPQKAVFKVPKTRATLGRYVDTDYSRCIGCHVCKDVCPTGYIQMGLGE